MANFTLILGADADALDITEYINQRVDIVETPIYTDGENAGIAKTGNPIFDRLNTRYKFSVPLIPLRRDVLAEIDKKCRANEMYITYSSYTDGQNVTKMAQCSLSASKFALDVNGERVYHGAVISCNLKS